MERQRILTPDLQNTEHDLVKLSYSPNPIRFYEPKLALDESEPEDVVHLKVKVNVDEADSRINVSSLSFFKIKLFMMNGSLIASQQHKMEQDIFIQEGMMGVKELDKQYAQFKRILTEDARSSFVDILKTARATFLAERAKDVDEEKKASLLSRKMAHSLNGSRQSQIK